MKGESFAITGTVVYVRNVPAAVKKKLRMLAAKEDKTMEQVAREALEAWVNKR